MFACNFNCNYCGTVRNSIIFITPFPEVLLTIYPLLPTGLPIGHRTKTKSFTDSVLLNGFFVIVVFPLSRFVFECVGLHSTLTI